MSCSSPLKSAVVLVLVLGFSPPCWAADSLLLVNRINLDKRPSAQYRALDLSIAVDGKSLGACTAESNAHVMCVGAIAPGRHRIGVQAKGGKALARTIDIRGEDAAMFWAGVSDDVRLWCVSVSKTNLALMPKSECWDIENSR